MFLFHFFYYGDISTADDISTSTTLIRCGFVDEKICLLFVRFVEKKLNFVTCVQDSGQVAGYGALSRGQDQPEPEVPPQEANCCPGLGLFSSANRGLGRFGSPPFCTVASFTLAVTYCDLYFSE